nr:hypothetical protein [Tanacetum cinerariifolium]
KDAAYHREKMLLCKQEEAGIELNAEQADWKDDTNDEFDDQELEAHYMYMAKIQEASPNIDQNDEDADLSKERELLASLIERLKCEIDESKNRNKFLETSNKVLIDKLKSKIKDFKNKNNSLEFLNNQFKEANNKLSEENDLLYADFKKSQAELKRRDSIEYASEMELECAKLVEIVLFIVDSGCSKHMTGNLKLLINFVEKFLGTVKFGNDQIAHILGYGDLVQGAVTIKRVYYVEGLNHILFSVGQFCDADLEVAFRKSTCFVCDLKGNDHLTGSHGMNLYSITLQDTNCPNPICLMAKATSSQAWLWHRRLSHLNFDTINLLSKNDIVNDIVVGLLKLKFIKDHLCSSCELGKAKRKSFHTKLTPSSKIRLHLLHMDLCGPMHVASINGKKYVLVNVDDYSRYTWTHFLRSKDETPEVLIDFLRLVQRGLQAQVRVVRTDKCTEFLNQTLHAYFATEGIKHQTSVARTPKQNDVVERRNRTLVEAARTMLSAAKVPLFFWAEAIATACFTQNRSLVIPRHEKTPYHIINDQKPSVKFFYIFGSVCYIVRDGENLDKMNEKGNECIFVGSSPGRKCQENVSHGDKIVTTLNELDLLFSPMFDELLNGSSKVVPKSSAVSAADAPNQRQHLITPLNNHTTHAPTCHNPTIAPTVTSSENITQAETHAENDQVADDEFINIFSTPVQDQGETSLRHFDSLNMHTFYQQYPSKHHWTKDHPLEQVIENPSQSIRTRQQLESDVKMCMFALTVSRTEPKNIKEAMADSAWIESMQEELH